MSDRIVLPTHPRFKNLTGKTFGKLLVLKFVGINRDHRSKWLCRCECGREVTANSEKLLKYISPSCGCWRHGLSATPEYNAWVQMIRRCTDSSYQCWPRYGGRGISVCERWLISVECFVADMGPRPSPKHSLDRIDNDANYEPENCRWATAREQAGNRRDNRTLTINGVTKVLAELSRESGIGHMTIIHRLDLGWPPEQAVFEPARHRYTNDDVRKMREMVDSGMTYTEVAKSIGACRHDVSDYVNGRRKLLDSISTLPPLTK